MNKYVAAAAVTTALVGCGLVATNSSNDNTTTTVVTMHSTCIKQGTGLTATPDRSCTPGAWIADLSGVCHPGFNPRPGVSVTSVIKRQAMIEYGLPLSQESQYELDHLYPVWLGGATVLQNLWPELNYSNPPDSYTHNPKDALEFKLYKAVCQQHTLSAQEARAAFEGSWLDAYHKYVGNL